MKKGVEKRKGTFGGGREKKKNRYFPMTPVTLEKKKKSNSR